MSRKEHLEFWSGILAEWLAKAEETIWFRREYEDLPRDLFLSATATGLIANAAIERTGLRDKVRVASATDTSVCFEWIEFPEFEALTEARLKEVRAQMRESDAARDR